MKKVEEEGKKWKGTRGEVTCKWGYCLEAVRDTCTWREGGEGRGCYMGRWKRRGCRDVLRGGGEGWGER